MFHRNLFLHVAFHKGLSLFHHIITMLFLTAENGKCGLTSTVHIYLENFGTIDRGLPVKVLLHEVDHQVQKGIGATVGINSLFISDQPVHLQIYFWEVCSETISGSPMRGTAIAIQQTRGSQ